MSRKFLISFFCLLLCYASRSQGTQMDVSLNKKEFKQGDTIAIDASVFVNGGKLPKGSLYLKLVDDYGKVSNMRWPIINGVCNADIIIPDSFPSSNLSLYFAATSNFFTLYGKITSGKVTGLQTILLTDGKDFLRETIEVSKEGDFEYKNRLFEDEATLFFSKLKSSNNDDLNIAIVSLLDSTFNPLALARQEITIGNPSVASSPANMNFNNVDSFVFEKEKMLQAVTVTAKRLTKAEQFSEKYSTGLFKSLDERVLDLLDDPAAASFINILDYLKGRVAGLRITSSPTGDGTAEWRNSPVYFYLDEMRVDLQTISMIPVSNIAIVKAYPPPFYGNTFGEGGAVAVYTKRGDYYGNSNKRTFIVKGYTPAITSLGPPQKNRPSH